MAPELVQTIALVLYVLSTPVLLYLLYDAKRTTEQSHRYLRGEQLSTGEIVQQPESAPADD